MTRPINVFANIIKSLKNLLVSVKIGNAKASPSGVVLAQISNTEFKVSDNQGNEGICKLVNKRWVDLDNDEMNINGYVLKTTSFIFISKVVENILVGFDGKAYNYEIDYDSTENMLLLTQTGY